MELTARPFPARASAVAARGMVATSQPLATRAGLRALERGGNAIDAALAAAAVLCVVEPMSTGRRRRLLRARLARRRADRPELQRSRAGGGRPRRPGHRHAAARPAQRHRAGRRRRLGRARAAPRPPRARRRARRRDRHRRARLRGHAGDRRLLGGGGGGTGALRGGAPRVPAGAARRPARAVPRARGDAAQDRERGAGGLLPRPGRRMRSARRRRSRSTTSPRRTPTGSSRCAGTTAASTCARSRRTGRAWPRCRRSASSTASTTRGAARSTACTSRPRR